MTFAVCIEITNLILVQLIHSRHHFRLLSFLKAEKNVNNYALIIVLTDIIILLA